MRRYGVPVGSKHDSGAQFTRDPQSPTRTAKYMVDTNNGAAPPPLYMQTPVNTRHN